MIQQTVAWALRNRWGVVLVAALLAGLGVYCYTQMNIDAYPDISSVQVEMITTYPGFGAEDVERQVTIPIELALAGVPHKQVIRSRTIFGLSDVMVTFDAYVDDYWARDQVFQMVGNASLPPGVTPQMAPLDTAYGEIYRYQLTGDTPIKLRELNDWVCTPRLMRSDGVAEVDNFGGLGKQYAINLDPNKMLKYGVALNDVITAVQANNSNGGGSMLQRGSTAIVIRSLGNITDYRDMSNIFIKNSNGTNVFVHDVGEVAIDHIEQTGIFGIRGRQPDGSMSDDPDSVEGIVVMRRGANPSQTLANIEEAVDELNSTLLPKGVHMNNFYNRRNLIHQTLHTVFENTSIGILLVVAILFLFLGSPRIALLVAVTIPLALLFALILMKLSGIPISLLSIGSIDFGVIVDGAIIVTENIVRHMVMHKTADKDKEILEASQQVQNPMLFSMIIVIMAYLPLLSLKYIEGLLFRPMAMTLCFSLLGALLIALYLMPVLASFFLTRENLAKARHALFDSLSAFYGRLLPQILKHAWAVVGGAAALFLLVMVLLFPQLGIEFLPYMDEGGFWLRGNFPEGISLKENHMYANRIRELVTSFKEVKYCTSQTGRNDMGSDPFPTDRNEFDIILEPRDQWVDYHNKLDLEAALRRKLEAEFPTAHFNLTQPIIDSVTEDTNGTSADLAVEIVGGAQSDLFKLRDLGEQTVDLLKKIPGAVNVNIEQEGPQPELQIRIDKSRLAHYGLAIADVNNVINTAVGGTPVGTLWEGERSFSIKVKYAPQFIKTPEEIGRIAIFNPNGEPIPLAQVADVRVVDGQTQIAREDGKRRQTVRCDIRGRAQGGFVDEAKKLFAEQIPLPDGYSVEWMGLFENLDRAQKHFELLIPLTVAIIFGILFLTFGSPLRAGMVLLAIPFALVGSTIALYVRGMHLSVSAGVGMTSLFGVAAMHGVLMVSYISNLREDGLPLDDAIIKGASLRLRPVLMTAMVAIIGLIPASLATGVGSDVQRPIATVVVWGLFSSAFLTLVVMPALYKIIEKDDPVKVRARGKRELRDF